MATATALALVAACGEDEGVGAVGDLVGGGGAGTTAQAVWVAPPSGTDPTWFAFVFQSSNALYADLWGLSPVYQTWQWSPGEAPAPRGRGVFDVSGDQLVGEATWVADIRAPTTFAIPILSQDGDTLVLPGGDGSGRRTFTRRDRCPTVRAEGAWFLSTVATPDVYGEALRMGPQPGMAMDAEGRLHIVSASGIESDAFYATNAGPCGWEGMPIDSSSFGAAVAVAPDGVVYAAYNPSHDAAITLVALAAEAPVYQDLDRGTGVQLAFDAAGHAHVAFAVQEGVRYGTDAGGDWTYEDVPGIAAWQYSPVRLAVDGDGTAHVASRADVARRSPGGAWQATALGDECYAVHDLAAAPDGTLHAVCQPINGGQWSLHSLAADGTATRGHDQAGDRPALAFAPHGSTQVAFVDGGQLAWATDRSGEWVTQRIGPAPRDPLGPTVNLPSLQVDPEGNPHIVYGALYATLAGEQGGGAGSGGGGGGADEGTEVTVTIEGPGAVTSNPSGIDCGITCSARFTEGTLLTLTAFPDATGDLEVWTGLCDGGTASTCQLTVGAEPVALGARFSSRADGFVTTAGSPAVDGGLRLAPSPAGGMFVAGRYGGAFDLGDSLPSPDGLDLFVAALDDSGNARWARSFTGPGMNAAIGGLAATADGGVLVAAAEGGTFVARLDGAGGEVWRTPLGADGSGVPVASVTELDGGDTLVLASVSGPVAVGGAGLPGDPCAEEGARCNSRPALLRLDASGALAGGAVLASDAAPPVAMAAGAGGRLLLAGENGVGVPITVDGVEVPAFAPWVVARDGPDAPAWVFTTPTDVGDARDVAAAPDGTAWLLTDRMLLAIGADGQERSRAEVGLQGFTLQLAQQWGVTTAQDGTVVVQQSGPFASAQGQSATTALIALGPDGAERWRHELFGVALPGPDALVVEGPGTLLLTGTIHGSVSVDGMGGQGGAGDHDVLVMRFLP